MKMHLLIIDGDPWRRETLAAALAYEGCLAEHTGEASFAMVKLEQHCFDIMLIDLSVAATCGWEIIKSLMSSHPTLPVIVLVPNDSKRHETLFAERIRVVGKPFEFSALLQAIQGALSGDAANRSSSSMRRRAASVQHATAIN